MTRKMFVFSIMMSVLLILFGMIAALRPVSASGVDCTIANGAAKPMLAIYMLAYDNPENADFSLTTKYSDTVKSIVDATAFNPGARAVVLADLGEVGDTHILVAANGSAESPNCLPDETGTMQAALTEYDMTDGETLGGFLLWVDDTFAADKRVVSYIGHGLPVVPEIGMPLQQLLEPDAFHLNGDLDPLPSPLKVNPALTDNNAPGAGELSLLTPHALRTALQIGSDNGANPYDVLDTLHCFAASIDELHEVGGVDAANLFALVTVGSPNYAFFDARMPGAMLLGLSATDTARDLGQNIVTAYDNFHPPTEHPHIIVAVDNSFLLDVKSNWDTVSEELLNEFDQNAAQTSTRLQTAYADSNQYDTSFCDGATDWTLDSPDALTNMRDFAIRLQTVYQLENPALANAANTAADTLARSVYFQAAQDGVPHFAPMVAPWEMDEFEGISLFTPFRTEKVFGNDYLLWQSLWYTDGFSIELAQSTTITNPHPPHFIQKNGTGATWADIVNRYHVEQSLRPGVDVETVFCGVDFPDFAPVSAELQLTFYDDPAGVTPGSPVTYTALISNNGTVTATAPVLTVELPFQMTYLNTVPGASCTLPSFNVVRCQLSDLAPNSAVRYRIHALAPTIPIHVEVEASVSSATHDPIPVNNSDVEETVVAANPLAVGLGSAEITTVPLPTIWLTIALCLTLFAYSYRKRQIAIVKNTAANASSTPASSKMPETV